MKTRFFLMTAILLIVPFGFCSCTKKEGKRKYTEIVIEPSAPFAPFAHGFKDGDMSAFKDMPSSAPDIKLSWRLPVDWVEREKGGMRLAAFSSGSGEGAVECTIISLPGAAGGLESNVTRWIGQINLEIPPQEKFAEFLNAQEKFSTGKGLAGTTVDLTQLTPDTNQRSMIAALVNAEEDTLFIKMTGTKASLEKNREKFKSLCRSLEVGKK